MPNKKEKEREIRTGKVKDATYELLKNQKYLMAEEVSDRTKVDLQSAAQILRHNFYRWNLQKGKDGLTGLVVYFDREDNLPDHIKIETTRSKAEEMKATYNFKKELAKSSKPSHKERTYSEDLTKELIDKTMEDLIKENGKFNFSGLRNRLNRKNVSKESIRKGMSIILGQYELRVNSGKDKKYEFKEGFAYPLKEPTETN